MGREGGVEEESQAGSCEHVAADAALAVAVRQALVAVPHALSLVSEKG